MDKDFIAVVTAHNQIETSLGNLRKALTENYEPEGIPLIVDHVNKLYQKYNKKWEAFEDKYSDHDSHLAKYNLITEEYYSIRSQALKFVKERSTSRENTPSPQTGPTPFKVKLPEIKLAKFSGNVLEWTSWWNRFSTLVDVRTDLDDTTKYTFLNQSLEGAARVAIAGFKGEPADYVFAIKALKDTFADENRVRRILIRKLLNLEKPTYTRDSILKFKLNLTNTLMQMEHDSKINVTASETIIAEIITQVLPKEIDEFLYNLHKTVYHSVEQIKTGLDQLLHYLSHESPRESKREQPSAMKSNNEQQNKLMGSKSSSDKTNIGSFANVSKSKQCLFCSESHLSRACSNYVTSMSRRKQLENLSRCTRCMGNHTIDSCKARVFPCYYCKNDHHSYLCDTNDSNDPKAQSSTTQGHFEGSDGATAHILSVFSKKETEYGNSNVALATATVTVSARNGKSTQVRCFFDCGSMKSFIHKNLANELQLDNIGHINMSLTTMQQSGHTDRYELVEPLVALGNRKRRIFMTVVREMPTEIETPGLFATAQKLRGMGYVIADKFINGDQIGNIQLLIGSDYFGRYISHITTVGNIDLFKSPGGHLIYGLIPSDVARGSPVVNAMVATSAINQDTIYNYVQTSVNEEMMGNVTQIWNLDTIGIDPMSEAVNDKVATVYYEDTVVKDQGKYWVELPFKVNHSHLKINYAMALGPMYNQVKRFKAHPEIPTAYNNIFEEQLKCGYIEEVFDDLTGPGTHYIPYYGVIKESSSTPLPIVFNCSAKSKMSDASLNDCLLTGPSLTENLFDVLLKYRTGDFAYCADISKVIVENFGPQHTLPLGLIVKFKGGIFKRSLNKIAPLEISSKHESVDHVDHESDDVELPTNEVEITPIEAQPLRPVRLAAQRAAEKRQD